MTTITKEWLQQTIAEFENTRDDIPFGLSDDDAKVLIVLKRALASLEAEPAGYHVIKECGKVGCSVATLEEAEKTRDFWNKKWTIRPYFYTAQPVQETGVYNDVLNIIGLLENNEWTERCTSTVLGSLLESEITRLVGKEQSAPVVPDEMATSDDMNLYQKSFAQGYNACRAAMLQGAEPVSQTYELPELIEGMEVSIDVSTCDADAGNRYFGTVTEVSELDTAKNGYILLVQDAKPNFDVNGNSPVIPGGWISCSERMPDNDESKPIAIFTGKCLGQGMFVATYDDDGFFDYWEGMEIIGVSHWMPLPAAPEPDQS